MRHLLLSVARYSSTFRMRNRAYSNVYSNTVLFALSCSQSSPARVCACTSIERCFVHAKLKPAEGPYEVVQRLLGRKTPKQVQTVACKPNEICEAQFYIGVWHVLRGERVAASASAKGRCRHLFRMFRGISLRAGPVETASTSDTLMSFGPIHRSASAATPPASPQNPAAARRASCRAARGRR